MAAGQGGSAARPRLTVPRPPLARPHGAGSRGLHSVPAKLLTDDKTKGVLQTVVPALDVLSKSSVQQSLIVATPCRVNLGSEPPKNIVVDPNRDPRLARRDAQHRPADPSRKV